jgi:hypothetical protein
LIFSYYFFNIFQNINFLPTKVYQKNLPLKICTPWLRVRAPPLSTSRGRHQPVVGVLCSFQVPVHSGIWIAGTSFFVCISHQHLFLLVLLFIVLWFWFPTDQKQHITVSNDYIGFVIVYTLCLFRTLTIFFCSCICGMKLRYMPFSMIRLHTSN